MVFGGFKVSGSGEWLSLKLPSTRRMFGLSMAMHMHGVSVHLHF